MRLLFSDCAVDVERRELRRAGEAVHVEPQAFDLLVYLITHRDRVVSKDELLEAVWNGRIVSDSALTTRINAARQAIGDSGKRQLLIQTLARRGFRFIADVVEDAARQVGQRPSLDSAQQPAPVKVATAPERPSIAVLPFESLGGTLDDSYVAEGLAEDLITSLSHIRWLTVIARNVSFAYKSRREDARAIGAGLNAGYLIEGSVRRALGRIRITVELIDAESGAHLWGDRFDGQIDDVFDLQDQISASVIGAIEPSLRGAEIARAQRKRHDNLGAHDLYLCALPHAYAHTAEGRDTALDLLGRALAIDPNCAQAHGLAAWCHIQRAWIESPDLRANQEKALAHAKAVMALRTHDASTLAFAANAYVRATGDCSTSIQMIEHALARNPSNAHALGVGAVAYVWDGQLDRTMDLAERALRLSPLDPTRHHALVAISRAKLVHGELEAAVTAARRAVQASPGHLPSHAHVLICLVRLRRMQELKTAVELVRTSFPGLRLAHLAAQPTFEPFQGELSATGLPD
jgi:TolB-like protein